VVIALAAVLDPVFAVGYFGISRSGNVSAVVNPLLTPDRLAHVLSTSAARVAIVSPELYRKLATIRHQLSNLETIVLTEPIPGLDLPVLGDLLAAAPPFTEGLVPQDVAEKVACLQFTRRPS
jgi:long-chain acyl-CoA synthetase